MVEILEAYEGAVSRLELVPGSGGVFEVDVDRERVYSKKATGRHAEDGEVLRLIRDRVR